VADRLLASIILLGASLAAVGPLLAQAPPEAPATPATSAAGTPAARGADSSPAPTQSPAATSAPTTAPAATPTATPAERETSPPPAAPAGPSADTLKKARLAGYRPETKKGITMYCQETANIGTRFPTKKCLDESQLKLVMDVHNDQADSLRQPGACTGAVCTGH
jgi:hypothetical protein